MSSPAASSISSIVIGAAARIRAEAAPPVISATARKGSVASRSWGSTDPPRPLAMRNSPRLPRALAMRSGKASVSSAPSDKVPGLAALDFAVRAQVSAMRRMSSARFDRSRPNRSTRSVRSTASPPSPRSTRTAARSAACRCCPVADALSTMRARRGGRGSSRRLAARIGDASLLIESVQLLQQCARFLDGWRRRSIEKAQRVSDR